MKEKNSPERIAIRLHEARARSLCIACGLRPREGFGLCRKCIYRKRKYGLPAGRPISRPTYSREWSEVALFLKRFIKEEHPACLAAIQFFDSWVSQSGRGSTDLPAHRTMAKVFDKGIPDVGRKMLHEVLSAYLYSSRRDTPSTRSPFLLFNVAIRVNAGGGPRGWCKPGKRTPPPTGSTLGPGYKERQAATQYISKNLRNVFESFLEYFKEKERLFNLNAQALQEKFPVKKNRHGEMDRRTRLARSLPGSAYSGTGNKEGLNQFNRAVDPVTERKAPKPPSRFGPIPYVRENGAWRKNPKKEGEKNVERTVYPRRAD